MRCETTSKSARYVRAQVYHVHHASICANVVIGVLVVLCELHVTRVVVVVDAVVGLTLGLIAHVVVVVFVVAILHRILCIWRYTLNKKLYIIKNNNSARVKNCTRSTA